MTEQEIKAAAWRELLAGAESALDDWIDEEGEYADLDVEVREAQREILRSLKVEHIQSA